MWAVSFEDEFAKEFKQLDAEVQDAILAYAKALASEGPRLGRPWADTLKGSKHANMKELRPTVNKVEWRVAFAFDPDRRAILLAAVAKGGTKTAYKRLIATADRRFGAHMEAIKAKSSGKAGRPAKAKRRK
ncbi:MAG TPA: type II toxin-antitoxin system RelE/ParE family toxin [Beijerinckiaceae bacterium]|nr:type II toxin-antitoxin system RelE/ParE family toxin [Beijerinckiaceae bacterium]